MNLIFTNSVAFYDGFVKATEVCKALRLADRDERIKVCRIVRDGVSAEDIK